MIGKLTFAAIALAAIAVSATATAAESVVDTTRDVTRATDQPDRFNPVAIELNPLGLIVGGRASLSLEYAPVTHHVVVVSPYFVRTSSDVAVNGNSRADQTFTGFGGEIGYRYYTGHRGMNGVFIGPSLIAGIYNANLPSGSSVFTNYGIAADVGVQQVFFDHLVLGTGVGIEYLKVSKDFGDLPAGPRTVASTSVKPRVLAQVGYAF